MTVVTNMHKTYVMSWLWRCHVSLMHTPSGKVFPIIINAGHHCYNWSLPIRLSCNQ